VRKRPDAAAKEAQTAACVGRTNVLERHPGDLFGRGGGTEVTDAVLFPTGRSCALSSVGVARASRKLAWADYDRLGRMTAAWVAL
jgi:hypothetical protein